MDHNCISDLKESMGQWTNLTHFNMAFNNISTMPNSCANWVNLEVCAATSLFLSLFLLLSPSIFPSLSLNFSESKPVCLCVWICCYCTNSCLAIHLECCSVLSGAACQYQLLHRHPCRRWYVEEGTFRPVASTLLYLTASSWICV